MDVACVIEKVIKRLDKEGVRYALIGGFVMGLRGVQRATVDMDFILMLDDMSKADRIFLSCWSPLPGLHQKMGSGNVFEGSCVI